MRPLLGYTAAAGTAVLASLVLVLALASGGGASIGDVEAAIGCKLAGKRFVGTTSQRKRLCLTLTADGRRLREYAYDYRSTCGTGNLRTTFRGGLPLSPNGGFNSGGTAGSYFKGKITGSTASGTTRSKQQTYILGQFQSCDTGAVRWNARKSSG